MGWDGEVWQCDWEVDHKKGLNDWTAQLLESTRVMLWRPQFAFIFVDGFNTRVNICEPLSLPNRLLLYKLLPGSLRGQLQQRGRELRENEGHGASQHVS